MALADYEKADELGYNNKAALNNNIAVVYRMQGEFDTAIEYIKKAKQENLNWPNIEGTLALIYADKGDGEKFYNHLQRALDKNCPVWNYLSDKGLDKYRD